MFPDTSEKNSSYNKLPVFVVWVWINTHLCIFWSVTCHDLMDHFTMLFHNYSLNYINNLYPDFSTLRILRVQNLHSPNPGPQISVGLFISDTDSHRESSSRCLTQDWKQQEQMSLGLSYSGNMVPLHSFPSGFSQSVGPQVVLQIPSSQRMLHEK